MPNPTISVTVDKVTGVLIAPANFYVANPPPGGGGAAWGGITGTLSNQTDLASALSGKQPLDSDLTAIAALGTTTFGRSLLTQADAAAAQTTLGLVIGTDVLAPNGDGSALTGTPAFDGANFTNLQSAALVGALPAIDGSALTGVVSASAGTGGQLFYYNGNALADPTNNLNFSNGSQFVTVSGVINYFTGSPLADASGNLLYSNNTLLADVSGNLYYGNNSILLASAAGVLYYGDGATPLTNASNQVLGDGSQLTGLLWSQIGSTPTTLAGYGITDAQAHSSVLDAIAAATPIANGTYTVGLGVTNNGTITTVGGIITAIQQAS